MNQTIKKINEESVLFFDAEVVRRSKELDINSREFELFQKKTRNRETEELLPDNEVVEEYSKRAALKMCYTKIVTIGVGFIKGGEVHIKALTGEENEIIEQFCKIAKSFDYVSGANIIGYDLPMITNNGYRYFDVCEILPDRYVTCGKKPWELKNIIDLMDIFRGTHYANSSLDEICYHFNLPSPKTDLDGSMVSEEYWSNGIEKIAQYVKQDVFASVNVFKKMRFEPTFEDFIDKNGVKEETVEEVDWVKELYREGRLTKEIKSGLKEQLKGKKKPTKKEREHIYEILRGVYVQTDFISGQQDNKDTIKRKEEEIEELLEEFWK